jgi:uncharacterized protein (TIGR02266 family)
MRTPVTLKIKFKSSNLDQFIERYSVDVSRGGIFIRTKEPLAVGTQLKFEFQLQDASSLISGEGTVVWIREHDPSRSGVAPGMGVKFDKLATASQQVLDRILNEKGKRGESSMESRFDAGVRASASASGNISTSAVAAAVAAAAGQPHHKMAAHNDFGGGDSKSHTPLPAPAPGMDSGADEFGEESTRVMQDAVVQALADKTRGDEAAKTRSDEAAKAAADFDSEPTKKATPEQVSQVLAKAEAAKVEIAPEVAKTNGKSEEKEKEPPKEAAKEVAPAPKEAPKEPVQEAAAIPAAVAARPAPQKSSAGMMMAALAILVLAGGGYVWWRNQEEPPPPPVNPAHTKVAIAAKAVHPPTEAVKTETGENPANPEAAKPAGLTVPITTDPPGATVSVDGKALAAPTPTELAGLEAGKSYAVAVTMKGFHEWKTNLKAKAGEKLSTTLVANEKLVEVSSTPAGADVVFDGKHLGKTPFTIHKLDATKPHELSVKRAGFVEQKRSITAGESFESKGDNDVLAVAMTLEAEAKAAPTPRAPVAKKTKKTTTTATTEEKPKTEEKPPEVKTEEKPVEVKTEEKPVEKAKPEEKPVEKVKTEEKPKTEEKAKPDEKEKANLKTPSWMEEKPAQ